MEWNINVEYKSKKICADYLHERSIKVKSENLFSIPYHKKNFSFCINI